MKLCKDCKWFNGTDRCIRKPEKGNMSPVDGSAIDDLCQLLRHFSQGTAYCGKKGRFWEAKYSQKCSTKKDQMP